MKTLKTKKYNIDRSYFGLMGVQPKDCKTIKEMENLVEISKVLEKEAKAHYALLENGDKINEELRDAMLEIPEEEERKVPIPIQEKISRINMAIKSKEEKDKKIDVVLKFENEEFNTFFQLFERWGKNWFIDIKEFLEFRRNLNDTNKQKKNV